MDNLEEKTCEPTKKQAKNISDLPLVKVKYALNTYFKVSAFVVRSWRAKDCYIPFKQIAFIRNLHSKAFDGFLSKLSQF